MKNSREILGWLPGLLLFTAGILMFNQDSVAQATAEVIRLSEPVSTTTDSETFGAQLDDRETALSLSQLLNGANTYLDQSFLLRTRIAKVCQKKGCFFIAHENDASVRVSFKDYGFFIPTDSAGKQVLLAGTLIRRDISEKQANHFAKDLGEAQAVKPGATYEIVANSVRISH